MTASEYKKLLRVTDDQSEVHYYWARLHDCMVTSQMAKWVSFSWFFIDRESIDLQEAVRHYCLCLQTSDRFLYHSIIRLTTLWFKAMQSLSEDLLAVVPEIESIKPYQWYIVFQQLLTVACHPNDKLKVQVARIVSGVFQKYPKQVVWQILAMLNVKSGPKREFMMSVGDCGGCEADRSLRMSVCIHDPSETISRTLISSRRS